MELIQLLAAYHRAVEEGGREGERGKVHIPDT